MFPGSQRTYEHNFERFRVLLAKVSFYQEKQQHKNMMTELNELKISAVFLFRGIIRF